MEASVFILEMLVLFVTATWLPPYTALFYISMRISSLIVPSWVAVAVTMVPTSYVVGVMVRRACRSKTLKSLRFMCHAIIVATLVLTATSTLVTVATVELYYPVYIANIRRNIYGASCQLDAAWSIATRYLQDYYSTYGKAVPKQAQIFELRYSGIHWIYSRAFVLARTGSCGDIAIAVTTLLHDALGCKTHVVVFKGWDHAIPEVMVNNTWYVFDITYTTPQYPVPANKYYEYLTIYYPKVASNVTSFIEYETEKDVSLEHGFPGKREPPIKP